MAVYLDLVMVLNFLVDFLLLLGTNRLAGFPCSPGRCAWAAVLGGLYSGACLLPGFRFLGSSLWRAVSLGLMAVLAFGTSPNALRRTGLFVLLSMALGGVAVSLGRGDIPALLLAAAGVWLLCRVGFGPGTVGQEFVEVTLCHGGKRLCLTALRDTGNTLHDPVTGDRVLVVDAGAARELTGLTREQLRRPLETLANHPLPGLRLVPYRAVGCAGGMLLAMRLDQVHIGGRAVQAMVAFAPEGLGREGRYQALTGGVL